ncbi:hypothetical protein [Microbacterium sp. TPU 3598]|uniref:hypothetical protein n=1 Tax=Microbacterium sp. TPU 3598 TaxID=1938334 RepID=UPI0012FDD356|nr:hypothetical protein [Microbacterium sp. TPU 3598]
MTIDPNAHMHSQTLDAADAVPVSRRAAKNSRLGALRNLWVKASIAVMLAAGVTTAAIFTIQTLQAPSSPAAAADRQTTAQPTPAETPDTTAQTSTPTSAAVTLGVVGGQAELDRCDGTFTHTDLYGTTQPPVWAAHNNCGGDVILPWEIGQEIAVTINGVSTTYRVVETRDTPKKGATTADLAGIGGELLLQTCYYGENRMKFLALDPVPATATTPAG